MGWKLLPSVLICYLSHHLVFLSFPLKQRHQKERVHADNWRPPHVIRRRAETWKNRCKWSNCKITKLYNYASILNDIYNKAIIDEQKKIFPPRSALAWQNENFNTGLWRHTISWCFKEKQKSEWKTSYSNKPTSRAQTYVLVFALAASNCWHIQESSLPQFYSSQ